MSEKRALYLGEPLPTHGENIRALHAEIARLEAEVARLRAAIASVPEFVLEDYCPFCESLVWPREQNGHANNCIWKEVSQ